MKSFLRHALVAGAVALTAMVALPSPAYAIDKVTCGKPSRDDWLVVQNQVAKYKLDTHCFANRGTVNVAYYNVWTISSGNNRVAIEYIDDRGQRSKGMILDKWQGWSHKYAPSPNIKGTIYKVSKITIL
ncbi:hypothetical protein DP939_27420 [Spongiactinospora rosea]|uniref:Streptomyces killer toxin-like beta/gamma crystallin domain-containing protein n=1 Tax=Spongiactinospora rosea TaxID=2248750 RepID=A0A366LS59_9ACTN|nr:beta/gamma crystallin domain-containing protein [Spongiactinospora rosea]RBQ16805.1 hypothetical protein DP939_27420 [Spongiactinospora rosea]